MLLSGQSLTKSFGPRPLFQAILAERGGVPVGMVLFYPDYSTHRGEPGVRPPGAR